ncbi:MAG TPA: GAF domain-containing sensor histidine kinase [Actinomycetota bacterium]|nr:GAF domain-containing sensor histidine kinase [Actinomycetota bacterium]
MTPRQRNRDGEAAASSLHGLLDQFVGLTSLREPEEILQRTVDVARLATRARYGAAVSLADGAIQHFVFEGLTQSEVDALPHLPRGEGMLGAVLEERTPIRRDRLQDDPRSVGFPLNHVPMRAFLGVPIESAERLQGAIYLTKPPGHGTFSEEDEFFLVTLASQTAVALDNAYLIGELRQQRAITELLERVAVASNEASDVPTALQKALDEVCAYTGWPVGHAFLLDRETNELVSSGIWRLPDATTFAPLVDATASTRLAPGDGIPGQVLAEKRAVWADDLSQNPRFRRQEAAAATGIGTCLGFPIFVESEVVGVLEFFVLGTKECDESLLEVGTNIGTQLGRVIERTRIEEGLRSLDQARSEFVANAAHELRTPLTTIMGLAEILTSSRTPLTEEQIAESMRLLKRQGERVGTLLTNLLDYSRVEAGSAIIDLKPVDVQSAVRRGLDAAPAPDGVDVRCDIDGAGSVMADDVRLEQILVNLLTNAYRYGGPHITIAASRAGSDTFIEVSDDGDGIEASLLPHLFDPFTRGASTQSITGSGLGLAIVKRLVESFGGTISCDSRREEGTTFRIELQTAG